MSIIKIKLLFIPAHIEALYLNLQGLVHG